MKYIALLRGINVGGNTKVPMVDLKNMFESLGFTEVRTLLNSGNVVFSGEEKEVSLLTQQLEQEFEKTFGFAIRFIVRLSSEIKKLVESDPFKKITVTPETRLYVTFLSEEPKTSLAIPYESPEKDVRILQVSNHELCSAIILSPKKGTVDLMSFLEKEFGKQITTRNWNTVLKLASL